MPRAERTGDLYLGEFTEIGGLRVRLAKHPSPYRRRKRSGRRKAAGPCPKCGQREHPVVILPCGVSNRLANTVASLGTTHARATIAGDPICPAAMTRYDRAAVRSVSAPSQLVDSTGHFREGA
jgi:hypothetical protein